MGWRRRSLHNTPETHQVQTVLSKGAISVCVCVCACVLCVSSCVCTRVDRLRGALDWFSGFHALPTGEASGIGLGAQHGHQAPHLHRAHITHSGCGEGASRGRACCGRAWWLVVSRVLWSGVVVGGHYPHLHENVVVDLEHMRHSGAVPRGPGHRGRRFLDQVQVGVFQVLPRGLEHWRKVLRSVWGRMQVGGCVPVRGPESRRHCRVRYFQFQSRFARRGRRGVGPA